MKPLIFFICFFFLFYVVPAQDTKRPITFSVFNNGTSLPGFGALGVFSKTIHPGFHIGTYWLYKKGEKHEFFQTAKLGYFYHRFVQHGIQLYSEGGYRYITGSGIYGEVLLGAGYLHSFPDMQVFVFKDGKYKKKAPLGRPQFMISAGVGVGYDFEKKCDKPLRLYLLYQFWMQTPFVNKYVPLLPNTSFHLGAIFSINQKSENSK
ncbi:MAG: hypothetical protein K2X86_04170 [Cytophagaceae bacterium]|nr:hypothetical protein [Cytophagaceae bacterium]